MANEWILIIEANLDIGVEADDKKEAYKKAEKLLEKIMIPDLQLEDGTQLSIDLQLQDVIKT